MVRQGRENFRRREGNVEEEPDLVAMAALPQRLGEGDQMIVMHPNDVVRL